MGKGKNELLLSLTLNATDSVISRMYWNVVQPTECIPYPLGSLVQIF